jgi:hypothetical protein
MLCVRDPFVLCRMGNDSFLDDPSSAEAWYRRARYDFQGYREIPAHVFGPDAEETAAIVRLLGRLYPPLGLVGMKVRLLASGGDGAARLARLVLAAGLLRQYGALRLASGPAVPLLRALLRLKKGP